MSIRKDRASAVVHETIAKRCMSGRYQLFLYSCFMTRLILLVLIFHHNSGSGLPPHPRVSFEARSFHFALEVLPLYQVWYIVVVFILCLPSLPSILLL